MTCPRDRDREDAAPDDEGVQSLRDTASCLRCGRETRTSGMRGQDCRPCFLANHSRQKRKAPASKEPS